MKKIINYINTNIIEFKTVFDALVLTTIVWLSWFIVQCLILIAL
jgi:hypothetical protein